MYQSFGTPFVNLLNFIINAFLNSVLIHASRSFVFVLCNLKWTPLWTGFLSSKNKPKQQWSLFWTTTTRKGERISTGLFSLFYLKFKKFYVCSKLQNAFWCVQQFLLYGSTTLYSMIQQQYVEWATINKKKEKRSFTLVMHTHTHGFVDGCHDHQTHTTVNRNEQTDFENRRLSTAHQL